MLLAKTVGAGVLAALLAGLLVQALAAHRHRRALGPVYYACLRATQAVALGQAGLGVWLLTRGARPTPMHLFYGGLVAALALAATALWPWTALGQRWRARPLAHAAGCAVALLVLIRAWITA